MNDLLADLAAIPTGWQIELNAPMAGPHWIARAFYWHTPDELGQPHEYRATASTGTEALVSVVAMVALRDRLDVALTEAFVRTLFAGRVDKGGKPYAEHCIRVMDGLPDHATDDERHAALLHDVLEDTDVTERDLWWIGYSSRAIHLVMKLTREEGVSYDDYVCAIRRTRDAGLIAIKMSDNADNSDPARLANLGAGDRERLSQRYARAREILTLA